MSLFGKSFPEKVEEALEAVRRKVPELRSLTAQVEGKTVTLLGQAPSMDVKGRAAVELNSLLSDAEQVFNKIRVHDIAYAAPAPVNPPEGETQPIDPMAATTPLTAASVAAAVGAASERVHEVVSGDTLGQLARRYYGNAGQYMKIFEANRDQLSNPDLIKVGQRLRIPA